MSGCCAFCEDGRLFPRLFRNSNYERPGLFHRHGGGHDCECHSSHLPPGFEGPMPGPAFMPGAGTSIPITNVPGNQPPNVFKVPNAPSTPFVPAN
jgi:hypothetical protein